MLCPHAETTVKAKGSNQHVHVFGNELQRGRPCRECY